MQQTLPTTYQNCVGNLVPTLWYKAITSAGKPDLVAITILSEILFKHRTDQMPCGRWRVGYGHFEHKFNFSKAQIRNALVRLEAEGVVTRQVLTEVVGHCKYGGVMYLHFSQDALTRLEGRACLEAPAKPTAPPSQKGEANKTNNKNNSFLLNEEDVRLFNGKLGSSFTLVQYSEALRTAKERYPNLLFYSKLGMGRYLQKMLSSQQRLGAEAAPSSRPSYTCQELEGALVLGDQEHPLQSALGASLKAAYGEAMYASWFSKLRVASVSGTLCTLEVPTQFIKNWVELYYLDIIYGCIHSANSLISEVEISVVA